MVDGEEVGRAYGGHFAPADAGETHRAAGALLESAHQGGAQLVTRFLAGDQDDREVSMARLKRSHHPPFNHRSVRSCRIPTMKIRARSAACVTESGSATMAPPATKAAPARPAPAQAHTADPTLSGTSSPP